MMNMNAVSEGKEEKEEEEEEEVELEKTAMGVMEEVYSPNWKL